MTSIFAEVVNMSSMAFWLILAVLVVRFLCQKTTKMLCYFLWALVGIRLLCPFSIESPWSMIPNQTSFEKWAEVKESIREELDIPHIGNTSEAYEDIKTEYEHLLNQAGQNVDQVESNDIRPIEIVSCVWGIGVLAIVGYNMINFYFLKRKVAVSIRKTEEIWTCDAIRSPFVLGIWRPRIYLPSSVEEEQITYILAHEKSHLEWHDHIWKLVGLLILAIHWFNPLVWLSYLLLCRDIEFACDERVVKKMDEQEKRNYVNCLLKCSSPKQFEGLGAVAFGEISIRRRVKKVLGYKKASILMVAATIVICGAVMIGFMTNPKGQEFLVEVEKEIRDELEDARSKKDVIYETTADLDHDGIDDLVQVIRIAYGEEGSNRIDYPTNEFRARIYLGEKQGKYNKKEVFMASVSVPVEFIWIGREFNGLYAITQYEGKDYLLYAQVCEVDGSARYYYEVVDVADGNMANQVDREYITFACDPFWERWDTEQHREAVVPVFQDKISPWLANAKIMFCSDENGVYVAEKEKEKEKSAKDYFDLVWKRSDTAKVAEYEALEGAQRWEKIIRKDSEEAEKYITWIKELAQSDFSKWYEDYNGEFSQRISNHTNSSDLCSLSVCCDVIYHEDVFLENTLIKMFWKMKDGRDEYTSRSTYNIYSYGFSELPVVQITENMWLVRYFNCYYGYQGVDGVTYDERVAAVTNYYDFNNGMVALPREGEASEYWFILMKKDGVYRLERLKNMMER